MKHRAHVLHQQLKGFVQRWKSNTMTRRKPWMNYLQTTVVPPWTDCSYDLLEKWFAENCNQTRVVTTPNHPQLCNSFAHSRKCTVSLSLSQETEAGEICFPKKNENQSPYRDSPTFAFPHKMHCTSKRLAISTTSTIGELKELVKFQYVATTISNWYVLLCMD